MKNNLIKVEPSIYNIINTLNRLGHQSLIVGGAVRDAILGITPKDIDIEVFKISYDGLMNFLSKYGKVDLVGKNFGVIKFKPTNGIGIDYDFSVPRKENKIGVTHKDFEVIFDIDMKIEDGAIRRDFTFNALAYDPIKDIIYDYFGGLNDLRDKVIRHTSDKFEEDYLRILRCMGFQSRFDFSIHTSTIEKMKNMLGEEFDASNEYLSLPKERLFEEFKKWAEKGIRHDLIFQFMYDTNLINYYPVLKALKDTPQDEFFHPEGSVLTHTILCLKQIDKIILENNITGNEKIILVMSVLLHDIAKPHTTENQMKNGRMTITSHGHEAMGGIVAREFLESIGFNEELIDPICKLIENHLAGVNISLIPSQSGKIKAVKKLSRRLFPATIKQLLYIMQADTRGRGEASESKVPTGYKEISEIANELTVSEGKYEYILMGRHLIEAGLPPSDMFGLILKASYDAQENGVFNNLEEGKKWLSNYLVLNTNNA